MYKCNVNNPFLNITVEGSYSRVVVQSVGSHVPDTSPILQYPRDKLDSNFIAMYGEVLKLQCIFSGKPAPIVTWTKTEGSSPISPHEVEGTILTIFKVGWTDQGKYACTGENNHGSNNFTFNVDVQSKPLFMPENKIDPIKRFESKNITEGETVEFTCDAHLATDPKPEVTIMINGNPVNNLSQANGRREITKVAEGSVGRILKLYNVCIDCPGVGTDRMTIQCKISNDHGVIMKNVYLNVLSESNLTSTTISSSASATLWAQVNLFYIYLTLTANMLLFYHHCQPFYVTKGSLI